MLSPASGIPDKVLVIDDEPDLRQLLTFNLGDAGFEVTAAETGADGLAAAARVGPEVIILDLMLPDISGTEVCRRLRSDPKLSDIGVLMLTARGDEYDRILGFEVGADDYVVKPFSVRELVLRVRALSTRARERRLARLSAPESSGGQKLAWRGIAIDPVRHRFYLDNTETTLRPLEFRLLALFLERPGKVFTRAELLEDVWGISGDVNTRTVDTHIRRLRERLGSYGDAIETVHGFGYRLRNERD